MMHYHNILMKLFFIIHIVHIMYTITQVEQLNTYINLSIIIFY